MNRTPLKKIIEEGIQILSDFFPLQSCLYFPLLSASLVWAAERLERWKENIMSWQVWLEPDAVNAKPDEFVLYFFKSSERLSKAFQEEINKEDIRVLRRAFACLFPVLGLEDPFLSALFCEEIESADFRKIVEEFIPRVSQAKRAIEPAKADRDLLSSLKAWAEELLALSGHLISQSDVRKMIAAAVRKKSDENGE